MRRIIDNDYITMLFRLLIGGVFIYASFYKVIEPGEFARSIWFYHLAPGWSINLIALILPWLELLSGLGLILGVFYRGSVFWVNLLLIFFIIALSSTIVRGIDIECGCFKQGQEATGPAWQSLIMDIFLLIPTLQLLLSKSRRWQICPGKN
jgi:uncharacterized membrane protein YphA (DoxX/SURF4 family)